MSEIKEKKVIELKKKISKYEKQIAYYQDTTKYFDTPRPKGLDTLKAEENLPELKLELEQLEK